MSAHPQKQTLIIAVVCVLVVAGAAFYVFRLAPGASPAPAAYKAADVAAAPQQQLPSGDWQRQFLGSTSTKSAAFAKPKQAAPSLSPQLTDTELLGQAFITKYAALKQAGLTADAKTVSNVMSQVAAENIASIASPRTYAYADIVIAPDSAAATAAYGSVIADLFTNALPRENEAVIASKAFDDNDMSELAQIDPIIASYKQMISRLLATPVPKRFIQYDLNLLNGLSISAYNAESLRHIDSDPMKGLKAVSLELAGIDATYSAFLDILNAANRSTH